MLLIILFLHSLILYLRPFTVFPEFYVYPYLVKSGLQPYSQIIDQHFPSLLLSPLTIFNTTNISDFKNLFVLTIIIQSLCIYYIAKKYFSEKIARLSVTLFCFYQPFIAGNAFWYDTLLPLSTLPAIWTFLNANYFISGVILGVGIILKQTLAIAVIGLAIYLFAIKRYFGSIKLLIGCSIPVSLLFIYEFSKNTLSDFIYWTFIFNFKVYPSLSSLFPDRPTLIYSMCLLIVVCCFVKLRPKFWLPILIITAGSFFGGLSRLDPYHLVSIVPLISIMSAVLFSKKNVYSIPIGLVLIIIIFMGLKLPTTNFLPSDTGNLIKFISENTYPNQEIYLLGVQPHVYALTSTLPPGKLFYFSLPWYNAILSNRQIEILKAIPPKYIVIDSSSQVDNKKISEYYSDLISYTHKNYKLSKNIGSYEIYRYNSY